jgi:general secretion pathway protein I
MTGRGFTLLEVMIAVAILGLSLTAIFSSEVGAANVAARARRQNVAATLARCKMGEIEEIIAIEGLPALEKKDTDSCCEHAPVEGFECEWLVERIILPELGAQDDEDEDEDPRRSTAKAAPRKR